MVGDLILVGIGLVGLLILAYEQDFFDAAYRKWKDGQK